MPLAGTALSAYADRPGNPGLSARRRLVFLLSCARGLAKGATMAQDRRRAVRKRKRIKVEFGTTGFDQHGHTTNISVGGLFIVVSRLEKVGTRVHVRLHGPESDFYGEAVVARARRVPPNLRRIERQGMGFRFLGPAEVIGEMFPRGQRVRETLSIQCDTAEKLAQILHNQLFRGVLLVPVEQPPALQTVVEFEIRLTFVEADDVVGHGRVVQLLSGSEGVGHVLIEVENATAIRSTLERLLARDGSG